MASITVQHFQLILLRSHDSQARKTWANQRPWYERITQWLCQKTPAHMLSGLKVTSSQGWLACFWVACNSSLGISRVRDSSVQPVINMGVLSFFCGSATSVFGLTKCKWIPLKTRSRSERMSVNTVALLVYSHKRKLTATAAGAVYPKLRLAGWSVRPRQPHLLCPWVWMLSVTLDKVDPQVPN